MITRRRTLAGLGLGAALPAAMLKAESRVLTTNVSLDDGRLLVNVGINDAGPFRFLIDTGSLVSTIRDDLAAQLRLPVIAHTNLGGMGGSGVYPVFRAGEMLIGATMQQREVVLVGAGNLNYGEEVKGTLAAGVLTAVDSALDFDRRELRLFPDGPAPQAGFERVASSIRHVGNFAGSEYIFVEATLDGRRYELLVDTGSPRPLMLFQSGVHRSGLWDDARPFSPFRPGGYGGRGGIGRTVRARSLSLGGAEFAAPLVGLVTSGNGALGDGVIGLPLIRRFNLLIDSRKHELQVQRNDQPAAAERYNFSGLWLERSGDTIKVASVGTGSPAAGAGIVNGDRVVAEDWGALLRATNGAPGTQVPLTIEHRGERRDVLLTLARYL